jgi:predicted SpoU family rRNA methylase
MSEVAALAVFLDWHLQHRAFDKAFPNGQVEIIPSNDQKRVQQRIAGA